MHDWTGISTDSVLSEERQSKCIFSGNRGPKTGVRVDFTQKVHSAPCFHRLNFLISGPTPGASTAMRVQCYTRISNGHRKRDDPAQQRPLLRRDAHYFLGALGRLSQRLLSQARRSLQMRRRPSCAVSIKLAVIVDACSEHAGIHAISDACGA